MRNIQIYFKVIINTIKDQQSAFLLWKHHFFLWICKCYKIRLVFSSSNSLDTLLTLVYRLGFTLYSFTWLTSISSFMHIIYISICIVWLLNSFDPSIFHNYSTRPNDGETKETNTRFYCVLWWYYFYKYDAKHLQASKDKRTTNKQGYKITKHLQASKKKILQKK